LPVDLHGRAGKSTADAHNADFSLRSATDFWLRQQFFDLPAPRAYDQKENSVV
jgi:hypothetical protein